MQGKDDKQEAKGAGSAVEDGGSAGDAGGGADGGGFG